MTVTFYSSDQKLLFGAHDPKHLGATGHARAGHGLAAALHLYLLRVLHISLLAALDAVPNNFLRFHIVNSLYKLIKYAYSSILWLK